jgi:hypothetical protein
MKRHNKIIYGGKMRIISIRHFFKIASSKAQIIGLGYPEVYAEVFFSKFGNKNAYILAKWMKEHYAQAYPGATNFIDAIDNGRYEGLPIGAFREGYDAAGISEDEYDAWAESEGLPMLSEAGYSFVLGNYPRSLEDQRSSLKRKLTEGFEELNFFYKDLITDIVSGKLTDIAQYKKMDFNSARDKYIEKKLFKDSPAMVRYESGHKWVDVGKRCDYIGREMKNCGSTGVMSMDSDKTALVLFGPSDKPHVIVTYSPNDGRISGVEGSGGSKPKAKYHEYILDLEEHLGVPIKDNSIKNYDLHLKSLFKEFGELSVSKMDIEDTLTEYFFIETEDKNFYSRGTEVITESDFIKAKNFLSRNPDFIEDSDSLKHQADKGTWDNLRESPNSVAPEEIIRAIFVPNRLDMDRLSKMADIKYISMYLYNFKEIAKGARFNNIKIFYKIASQNASDPVALAAGDHTPRGR